MSLKIEKASISFRISVNQWITEERFKELLSLFEKYKGVTDEITFFTSETHAPLPLKVIRERVDLLKERMSEVRRLGYKTGINVLATLGHRKENLLYSLSGDYTYMTDIDGNSCLGVLCPSDEKNRDYIKQLYEIVASSDPDYIWIDDDVRLFGHSPILCGCFCDICLNIFKEEYGIECTREMLKTMFNSGPLEEKLRVRQAWIQHNRNNIAKILELIERTVHSLNPNISLGFMTGDRFYEGYDFDRWANMLSGSAGSEVRWRPGGGFYTDERMKGLIDKSHNIGRQVSLLPEEVVIIQSEIENFTYQRLKKAAYTTALEAASHIAAGCTGAAFNVLSMYDEPLKEYEPLIAKLYETRPFFDLLARELGRSEFSGIRTGWNKDSFVVNNITGGNWFEGNVPRNVGGYASEIFEIGLPVCYSPQHASITLLSGDNVLAMNDDKILKVLSSGVYMDAQALKCLNELGYEKLTGFRIEKSLGEDCIEEFVEHHLNLDFVGRRRDGRQSFWKYAAGIIEPQSERSEILARIVDYGGKEVAPCCMGVFENELGGRICVAGYYPWTSLQNLSKSTQIKSIMRWLSKDNLLGYIGSFHKINIWIRGSRESRISVALVNTYFDTAQDVKLMLFTEKEDIDIFDMTCSKNTIHSSGIEGSYKSFILPPIEPWQMRLITV